MVLRSFAAAILLAVLACLAPAEALAGGNIKPGVGVNATYVPLVPCSWETTIAVTASTLDTICAPCMVESIMIQSQTAGLSWASKAIGHNGTIAAHSSRNASGWKVVDYDLTTWVVGATELALRSYLHGQPDMKAIIIDGLASGNLTLEFSN